MTWRPHRWVTVGRGVTAAQAPLSPPAGFWWQCQARSHDPGPLRPPCRAEGGGRSPAPQWFQICGRLQSAGGEAEGWHPDPLNTLDVSCPLARAGAPCLSVSAMVQLSVLAASRPASSPLSSTVCVSVCPWLISSPLVPWGFVPSSWATPQLGKDAWPVMPQES